MSAFNGMSLNEWVPDSVLDILKCEKIAAPDKTDEERAREILMQAAPAAAMSVAFLAVNAGQETVRLAASRYIIDGVVGGNFKKEGGEDDALMQLLAQLAENDEINANAREHFNVEQ